MSNSLSRIPARHILAAVVTDALDDSERPRVAHAEALAGGATEEGPPARRSIQRAVA